MWHDFSTIYDDRSHGGSLKVESLFENKLSVLFPHERSEGMTGGVSRISHDDKCNIDSFNSDFSCINTSPCYTSNYVIYPPSQVEVKTYDNKYSSDNHNDLDLIQMTSLQQPSGCDDTEDCFELNEKQLNFDNSPRAFTSVAADNIKVALDKNCNGKLNKLDLGQNLDNMPPCVFNRHPGCLNLCSKSNILATFNDTKQIHKILDKNIGFVSVPIVREHNWEQGTVISAPSMLQWAIEAHSIVSQSKIENYKNTRIIVPSDLKIDNWKTLMRNHPDNVLVQYLEYGFPLGIDKKNFVFNQQVENHPTAKAFPEDVDIYLHKEIACKAMVGPCPKNIFSKLHISPMLSRPKPNASRRIIVDLSWPKGQSVNSAVRDNCYDDQEFILKYPSVDHILESISHIGKDAQLFKIDIS